MVTSYLEFLSGSLQGKTVPVATFPFSIGRAPDCRLRFDPHADSQASAHHCQIECTDGRFYIVDLSSTNGTLVNEAKVTRQVLGAGDVITFGRGGPAARFGITPAAPPPAPPPPVPSRPVPQQNREPRSLSSAQVTVTVTWHGQTTKKLFSAHAVRIGRHPTNDITFDQTHDTIVSANHAKIAYLDGEWKLHDLESTNGTWKKSAGAAERITVSRLRSGDTFELGQGGPLLEVQFPTAQAAPRTDAAGDPATVFLGPQGVQATAEREQVQQGVVPLTGEMIIGRHASCTVMLGDPQVSHRHARLFRSANDYVLEDLGSRNGTFVNGRRIGRALLQAGDTILIGGRKLQFQPSHLVVFDFAGGQGLECFALTRIAGTRRLLDEISLSIKVGEFVAILGPSGGGKSTLMKALNGYRAADSGSVHVVGTDLYGSGQAVRSFIGYVPQDDAVHSHLTVQDTIDYAARLRLPPDFSRQERKERVERVLSDLELLDHRKKYVYQLSGGQRKRVSIGVELLTDPRVLFLDEPTSGLDPGMEYNLMRIGREIACMGRTVILTTHAMTNIALCDKLIFLIQGKLAYFGPPPLALDHFQVDRYESLFEVYKQKQPQEWKDHYRTSALCAKTLPDYAVNQSRQAPAGAKRLGPKATTLADTLRQGGILLSRYAVLTVADPWNVASLLLLSPFVIGVAFLAVTQVQFSLLMLSVASYWLACQNASKEVVKELTIYKRERMVNLGILPYLASKLVLLTVLAAGQAAVLFFTVVWLRGYTHWPLQRMYEVLFLTAFSGVTAGLLISVAVRTMDQAQTAVPILLICQVVLSGAFQGDTKPTGVLAGIHSGVSTYWSYDQLKRIAAGPVGRTRDEIDVEVKRLEARQDELKERSDRVEEERKETQRKLDEENKTIRSRLDEKAEESSDPREIREAQRRADEKMQSLRKSMDKVDDFQKQMTNHRDRMKEIADERKDVGEELKKQYKEKITALWFNHLGADKLDLICLSVIALLTVLACVATLRMQDFRELE